MIEAAGDGGFDLEPDMGEVRRSTVLLRTKPVTAQVPRGEICHGALWNSYRLG
jgi:hypothetical protein